MIIEESYDATCNICEVDITVIADLPIGAEMGTVGQKRVILVCPYCGRDVKAILGSRWEIMDEIPE